MKVLIIDDNPDHRALIRRKLVREFPGVQIEEIVRRADLERAIADRNFDMVFTDYGLHWSTGLDILKMIQERCPDVPVIMVTDTGSEEIAAEGMKAGLSDYVLKGHLHRIPLIVRESLDKAQLRKEHAEAQRQLGLSEERYRLTAELSSDYAYAFKIHSNGAREREWVTPAYERITGHPVEVLDTYDRWLQTVHPEDRELMESRWARLLQGEPCDTEFRMIIAGGGVRWFCDYARAVCDNDGRSVIRVYGAAQDVTDRKHAEDERDRLVREQALRAQMEETEQRYRSLAEAIPQMVWTAGPDGGMDYHNQRWYDYTGHDFERSKGWGWESVVHSEDIDKCRERWRESLARGERFETEIRMQRSRDGSHRWHLCRAVPLHDAEGRIVRWFGTCTDIDDQRRSEEAMRQSAKLESIGLLAGGVAHDFNNLLTGIMGNTSLAIEMLRPGDPAEAFMHDVLQASEKAADLTKQLLAYSGKGRFYVKPVNLSAAVSETINLVRTQIEGRAQLRLLLRDDLPQVSADPTQIQQLVMNLVINAGEAIEDGKRGSVTVSTSVQEVSEAYAQEHFAAEHLPPGSYVRLEVSDNGTGMDERTRKQIFDPFFTTKFMGRGLGLAAVLGIVRGHKGAIRVTSLPGHGSSFEILLPAIEKAPALAKPPAVPARDLNGAGTVLVVDDEEIVRKIAKSALERFGYRVLLAEDGEMAVKVFQNAAKEISLVLLDMTMPLMSGEEALRRLQAIRPGVRTIASSGYNAAMAMQRFAGYGLKDFIQKPYTAEQLAEKVKAALRADT